MAGESFHCSLCGRRVKIQSRSDMPVLDPNTGFAICKSCIKNIYHFIKEDEESSLRRHKQHFNDELSEMLERNKPHLIKEYLDDFIIMQDRAKKILSVAAYNHYKRMKYDAENIGGDEEIEKSNVIIMGPTGCGKTAMLSHLSRLLDIPFAVTDASSLTEAGFVGADVEVAVRNLYYAAGKDIEKTEHGII